jgi:poly(3-hydroxybutyrate) depolymerase
VRILTAVLLFSCSTAAQAPAAGDPAASQPQPLATADVPVGKAERTVRWGDSELTVFTYRPANWSGQRLLFVMHGVLRNADEYRDHALGLADRHDLLVAAPKFDAERFPSWRYQRGGLLREDGAVVPAAQWTYAAIPELAQALRLATGLPRLKHWVIGHSAGGQFVVRMSAFQDTGAERLVAANPGTVLWPVRELPFGYGFGKLPEALADDARLRAYLAAPLTLYLGTADDQPDEYFDASATAMLQGSGRHQRGVGLFYTARAVATLRGWPFGWRLVEAPGVGHDHERMFDHERVAEALFGAMAAAPTGTPAAGSTAKEPAK